MTRPAGSKMSKQFSKGQDGMSNSKKRQQAIGAIKQVVEHHNMLAKIVDDGFKDIASRIEDISVVLQAISQVVGLDKVNEKAKEIRIQLLENESAEQGKNVEKAVAEGRLVVTETATENTLVVTTVKKADGSPMYPSKSYLPFAQLKPEVQAVLRDKKVGAVETLPTDGGTIELLAIYLEGQPNEALKAAEVDLGAASEGE